MASEQRCYYCGEFVQIQQACVVATCSEVSCGKTSYHYWCVEEYCKGLKEVPKAAAQKQKQAQKDDHSQRAFKLLERQRCPIGRSPKLRREGLPACPGRVVKTEIVDLNPRGGKKKVSRPVAAPAAGGTLQKQATKQTASASKVLVSRDVVQEQGSSSSAAGKHTPPELGNAVLEAEVPVEISHTASSSTAADSLQDAAAHSDGRRSSASQHPSEPSSGIATHVPAVGVGDTGADAVQACGNDAAVHDAIKSGHVTPARPESLKSATHSSRPASQSSKSRATTPYPGKDSPGLLCEDIPPPPLPSLQLQRSQTPEPPQSLDQLLVPRIANSPAEGKLYININSQEEAEAAIREDLLPASFRTKFCQSYTQCRVCPHPRTCMDAHSLEELRIDAAIELGCFPADFKTQYCQSLVMTGHCPHPRSCLHAHSLRELRVAKAIEIGFVDSTYKTTRCPTFDMTGACPKGLLCYDAHGAAELRRQAAMFHGLLPQNYKTHLCRHHLESGCAHGDRCIYAHGVRDLNMTTCIVNGVKAPNYKSRPCLKWQSTGRCNQGVFCNFAHGHDELMPELLYKSKFCPTLKEMGRCSSRDCFFAHDASELNVPNIRSKLIQTAAPTTAPSSSTCHTPVPPPPPRLPVSRPLSRYSESDTLLNATQLMSLGHENTGADVDETGSVTQRGEHIQVTIPKTEYFTLCKWYAKGICERRNCVNAHGKEELREREWKYRVQAREKHRTLGDYAMADHTSDLHIGASSSSSRRKALEHDQRSRAPQSRSSSAVSEEPWEQGAGLSHFAIAAMKRHKESRCRTRLLGLGFDPADIEVAIMASGAHIDRAVQYLLEGVIESQITPSGGINVSIEVDEVVAMCMQHDLQIKDVSTEIACCGGDFEQALAKFMPQPVDVPRPQTIDVPGDLSLVQSGAVSPCIDRTLYETNTGIVNGNAAASNTMDACMNGSGQFYESDNATKMVVSEEVWNRVACIIGGSRATSRASAQGHNEESNGVRSSVNLPATPMLEEALAFRDALGLDGEHGHTPIGKQYVKVSLIVSSNESDRVVRVGLGITTQAVMLRDGEEHKSDSNLALDDKCIQNPELDVGLKGRPNSHLNRTTEGIEMNFIGIQQSQGYPEALESTSLLVHSYSELHDKFVNESSNDASDYGKQDAIASVVCQASMVSDSSEPMDDEKDVASIVQESMAHDPLCIVPSCKAFVGPVHSHNIIAYESSCTGAAQSDLQIDKVNDHYADNAMANTTNAQSYSALAYPSDISSIVAMNNEGKVNNRCSSGHLVEPYSNENIDEFDELLSTLMNG